MPPRMMVMPGYGEIRLADFQHRTTQVDDAGHFKDDDTRACGFDSFVERTGPVRL